MAAARLGFEVGKPCAPLTIVVGLGDRGGEIAAQLGGHLGALPEALRLAVRVVVEKDCADLTQRLDETHSEIASRANTEKIISAGGDVEGRAAGSIRLRYWFVWDQEEKGAQPECVSARISREPAASFLGMRLQADTRQWGNAEADPTLSLFVVGSTTRTGQALDARERDAAVAGVLLVSLLPSFPFESIRGPGGTCFPGFAGAYGLAGASLEMLAKHVALSLIQQQLDGVDDPGDGQSAPSKVTAFEQSMSPAALGIDLFDARLAGVVESDAIPAVPRWSDDGVLEVRLNRSRLAIDLSRHPDKEWANQLRTYSRTFDMVVACRWRALLEKAAKATADKLSREYPERFRDILDTVPHAPVHARHVLQRHEEMLAEDRRPLVVPSGDFDAALDQLDAEVQAKPKLLGLCLRMALWVIPALILGATAIETLYGGVRSLLFPALYVTMGLAGAVSWVIWKVSRARRRVQLARDRAIEVLADRQEAILSENAVGYLEEVVAVLASARADAQALLESYDTALGEGIGRIQESVQEQLDAPMAFAPVLVQPDEYKALLESLGLDWELWLKAATQSARFAGLGSEALGIDRFCGDLVNWCQQRLSGGEDVRLPEYGQLWNLREAAGNVTRSVDTAVKTLHRLAEPMAAAQLDSEWRAIGVPLSLESRLSPLKQDAAFRDVSIVPTPEFPMLFCVRVGLSARRIGVAL